MIQTIRDRLRYEATFTLAERRRRCVERAAQFVAWHCLPREVRKWVVVRAHADTTRPNQHPDTVSAFALYDAA